MGSGVRGSGDRGQGVWKDWGAKLIFFYKIQRKWPIGLLVILRSTTGNVHLCVDYFVTRPT